jgi:hypothetical protein
MRALSSVKVSSTPENKKMATLISIDIFSVGIFSALEFFGIRVEKSHGGPTFKDGGYIDFPQSIGISVFA